MKNEELNFREIDGRRFYFPWGIGKAYVLPDAGVENRVKKWIKARQIALFTISPVLIVAAIELKVNLIATIGLIACMDLAVRFAIPRIALQGLEVVFDWSNAAKIAKRSREPKSLPKLLMFLLSSLAFVLAGASIYSQGVEQGQKTFAVLCMVFFGLCALVLCIHIFGKLKVR